MHDVALFEAENRLSGLVHRVEAGEEIAITRRGKVWVPALRSLETGSLPLDAQRRKRIGADKRAELVAAAAALRLEVDREPVGLVALHALAARYGLTMCDAPYLEPAVRRSLPLATPGAELLVSMADADVAAWPAA